MEILHSLSPEKGMRFVSELFANEKSKYYLTLDKPLLSQR
jgi:hypothetical protein